MVDLPGCPEVARVERDAAAQRRTVLAKQLQDARVAELAPFMADLEDVATEIGRIEQRLAALPALAKIFARRNAAEQATALARAEVAWLTALLEVDRRAAADVSQRRAAFADHMSEFLENFRNQGWVSCQVTISGEDLTFYVGTRPWGDNLGAESSSLVLSRLQFRIAAPDRDHRRRGLSTRHAPSR